jgi:hypothetical protein
MAVSSISLESVEVTLVSGIGMSSATLMKDAYLPRSGEPATEGQCATPVQPGELYPGVEQAGPDARMYVTKIVTRTPDDVIEQALRTGPGRTTGPGNHDFYTVMVVMSIRPGDPATTRLVNGMIEFAFEEETEIIGYAPKDKGSITALIENGGDTLCLSRALVFSLQAARLTNAGPDSLKNRFLIPVGPEETLPGSYTPKTGFSLAIPTRFLLEYEGFCKNQNEVTWEFYPPMPPLEHDLCTGVMLAVFSLIVRAPRHSPPKIRAGLECRVKGNLWGVVHLKGLADLP